MPSLEDSASFIHNSSSNEPSPTNGNPHKMSSQTASNKEPAHESSTFKDTFAHNTTPDNTQVPDTKHQHVWYITGPAGCGKSTVARYISNALKLPYLEGDNVNIDKMANGHPLDDADRWDWLISLRVAASRTLAGLPTTVPSPNAGGAPVPIVSSEATPSAEQASAGNNTELPNGVVVTCSALKNKYRDVLRVATYDNTKLKIHFVYLHATMQTLMERVGNRKDHYMGAQMVKSQFDSLEVPTEEERDVITVDVSRSAEEVESEALKQVERVVRGLVQEDS